MADRTQTVVRVCTVFRENGTAPLTPSYLDVRKFKLREIHSEHARII